MYAFADAGKTKPIQSQNKPNFKRGTYTALRSVAQDKYLSWGVGNIISFFMLRIGYCVEILVVAVPVTEPAIGEGS